MKFSSTEYHPSYEEHVITVFCRQVRIQDPQLHKKVAVQCAVEGTQADAESIAHLLPGPVQVLGIEVRLLSNGSNSGGEDAMCLSGVES